MDRTGADFYKDVESIWSRLSKKAHPIQLPIGTEGGFNGIIDLFKMKAFMYRDELGKQIDEIDIPAEYADVAKKWRAEMVEAIAETDENLSTKYLEGKELTNEELKPALRRATIKNDIFPIICGSSLKNKGVQLMLDAIVDYLPSPLDIPPVKAVDPDDTSVVIARKADDSEPFTALAFKIAADPFVGKLAFFRVYAGTVKAGSYVLNTSTGERERIGRIVRLHANTREEVQEVHAGDIAAAVGLKSVSTGDTMCNEKHPIVLESMDFPKPVISLAIEPKTKDRKSVV